MKIGKNDVGEGVLIMFNNKKKEIISTSEKSGAKDIYIIITTVFCIVVSLTLITNGMIFGEFGQAMSRFFLGVFGFSAYPLFLGGLLISFLTLFKKKIKMAKKHITALSLAFVAGIFCVHLFTTSSYFSVENVNFGDYIAMSYNAPEKGLSSVTGGGVISSLFVYPLARYITQIGTYIVLGSLFVVSALVACDFLFSKGKKSRLDINKYGDYPLNIKQQPEQSSVTQSEPQTYGEYVRREQEQSRVRNPQFAPKKYENVETYQTELTENTAIPRASKNPLFVASATGKNEFEKRSRKEIKSQAMAELNIPLKDKEQIVSIKSYNGMTREQALIDLYGKKHGEIKVPMCEMTSRDERMLSSRDRLFGNSQEQAGQSVSYIDNFEKNPIKDIKDKRSYIMTPPSVSERYPQMFGGSKGNLIFGESEPRKVVYDEKSTILKNSLSLDSSQEDITSSFKTERYETDEKDFSFVNIPIINGEKYSKEERNNFDVLNIDELARRKKERDLNKNSDFNVVDEVEMKEQGEQIFKKSNRVFVEEELDESPMLKKDTKLVSKKPYHYQYPPTELLNENKFVEVQDEDLIYERGDLLEQVCNEFGISAIVQSTIQGPSVTKYELSLPHGVKVKKVIDIQHDIQMRLKSSKPIRIEAPIPGKALFGVEVANEKRGSVSLRDIVSSRTFKNNYSPLTFAVGKDVLGEVVVGDIGEIYHLLVAGSTGSGKSVCLNSLIVSMLYKSSPEDLKLILIDPKQVEFQAYTGIPHLLLEKPITDSKRASAVLDWSIAEMERRFNLFAETRSRDLKEHNIHFKNEVDKKLPSIVIVIDEFADLIISDRKNIEEKIIRLTSKARAAGIHVVLATQRPSVDVITGLIKNNILYRMAFAVSSAKDSCTILDEGGAEDLMGKGDMLYKTVNGISRVQGCFVSNEEIDKVVSYVIENNEAYFDEDIKAFIEENSRDKDETDSFGDVEEDAYRKKEDPLFKKALEYAIGNGSISISKLQRIYGIGYSRAGKLIDDMERYGFISEADGAKPRQILISMKEFLKVFGGEESNIANRENYDD